MLDELLKNVAVVGAQGKMGFQIATLLLEEIAITEARNLKKTGTGEYTLTLIDLKYLEFTPLKKNLKKALTRYAEKNINRLRDYYREDPYLISNQEIIEAFVEGALNNVRYETELSTLKSSKMIFEAIVEDVAIKVKTFKTLQLENADRYYFTNTSSIPIHVLEKEAQLNSKIIGFHFYNPPEVQKLVEIIEPNKLSDELRKISLELTKRLNKVIVHSKDVAGFIGNGHFIRECLYGLSQIRKLQEKGYDFQEAFNLINFATENYLMRPMGIFQLMDFVGLDVVSNILKIMKQYLNDPTLEDSIIDEIIRKKVLIKEPKNQFSGITWKELKKKKEPLPIIVEQLKKLKEDNSVEGKIAFDFLNHSYQIAENLVKDNIANSMNDIDTVLKMGFFHLYGISIVKEVYA